MVGIVEKFQHQTSPIFKQQTQIYQGVWGLRYASGIRCTEMRANPPPFLPYINIYNYLTGSNNDAFILLYFTCRYTCLITRIT